MSKRLCIDCNKRPAYERSSYCGKCMYARQRVSQEKNQEREKARVVTEAKINFLSWEIGDLIGKLAESEEIIEKVYLRNRLETQTKNLSYLAQGLVRG